MKSYFKILGCALMALVGCTFMVMAGTAPTAATRAQVTTGTLTTNTITSQAFTNVSLTSSNTVLTNIVTVISTNSALLYNSDDAASVTITNKGSFPMFLSGVNPVRTNACVIIIPAGGKLIMPSSTQSVIPSKLYGVTDSNDVNYGTETWIW